MSQGTEQHQVELKIDGMSCGHCVAAVREALESIPGAVVNDVGIGFARVTVPDDASDDASGGDGSASQLTDAVDDAGYSAQVVKPAS